MPVGGFVITVIPEESERITADLETRDGVTIYGDDELGNLVVVLEADSGREMEKLAEAIQKIDGILTMGMTYLNVEDEVAAAAS
jgi:nitrate reductase NapAB chaperone NapD